jgi:chitodextrinase
MSHAARSARRAVALSPIALVAALLSLFPAATGADARRNPARPQGLWVDDATPGTLSVTWKLGSARGGRPVLGYDVYLNGTRVGRTIAARIRLASLSCGTTYTVSVRSFDSAGRRSKATTVATSTSMCSARRSAGDLAPTTTAGADTPATVTTQSAGAQTVTATSTPTTTTVSPGADARVSESSPSSNAGSSTYIRVDAGSDPEVQSYLQFAVGGVAGAVQKATLRAYAVSDTSNGPSVYATSNTWTERGITWNNRPPIGAAASDVGAVQTGTWVEWDVTALVSGSGTYSFALVGASSDGLNLSSREGAAAPQLVVTTNSGGPIDTNPPTAPGSLVATGASESSVSLGWSPSTDNVGVSGYRVYRDGANAGTVHQTAHTVAGLACGTTYRFAVAAYDAAGNVSPQSTLTAATAACQTPPDPGPVTCAKVASPVGSDGAAGTLASPYRTPQKLAASLSPGQTGCLRGGAYTATSSYVLEVSRGGIRLRSFPGERARLIGIVHVKQSAAGVTLSHLDIEGTGGANTVKVYAPDVVLEHNWITNLGRGRSCLILGSNSGYGQAARAIVRGNRFHDCGATANGNKDHGVYAQNVVDGEIVRNVFWNSAAYAIQLYPNAQRTRFAYNVVDGDTPSVRGGVVFGGDSSYASSNNVAERNVISYAVTYNVTSTWSGSVGSGNIARNNCLWAGKMGNVNTSNGGFTASSNTVTNPLFLDRRNRDYRLAAVSACLGVVGLDPAAALAP